MTLRLGTILLICCAGCVLAQYGGNDGHTPPKKPLLIPGARRIKQPVASPRISNPQTSIINQRFRRPIPINRPRPSVESIPELPVFTSGIRGSRPSSAINLEQNDEPSLPIQTIQQPHIVHAQSIGQPLLQKPEVKPVSEENEKDEDVVQVIANLGQVSTYGAQSNLLTPTPLPAALPTVGAYGHLQSERQQEHRHHDRQQEQRQGERHEEQRQQDRQQDLRQQERQQEHRQHDLRQQDRQNERLHDRQQERQHHHQDSMGRQQDQRQQQEQRLQQQIQTIQYRPAQQIARSSANVITDQIHQVIAPVQYRPQKPVRLQKQQQQQHLSERNNEYDINEARPVVKQRPQVAPKKSKPQSDYYEGRTKKPVAQVIRRYREETADGSIIWGFENDDGSFKEEIIGIDCITRGKYGYVDPDGLRREYTYETGIKCDEETQQQQDQDILNTFVDYQENKLVLPSGKTIDLSSMGKKQARRPSYRNL